MNLNGGYAMIKYNSTQEELQIAYRSKRPALFYDENQRAHWAVIEETAKESIDEETQEPITLYEYSYKLLNDIEALVDSNGNPRFIVGNGNPESISGMTIASSKWTLNGCNLMFEINGSFSATVDAYKNICTFVIPQWISDKIQTEIQNLVDINRCELVHTNGSITPLYFIIYKNDNNIVFNLGVSTPQSDTPLYFKERYNIIIDNE